MSGTGRSIFAAGLLVTAATTTAYSAANFDPPEWAYPSTSRDFKSDPDDGKPNQEMIDVAAVCRVEDALRSILWHISPLIWP